MEVRKLKVGDEVIVETMYTQYGSMSDELLRFIGQTGTIAYINDTTGFGSCRIVFQGSDSSWYFPQCVLRRTVDTKLTVKLSDLRPKQKLFIGRPMYRIKYRMYIREINEILGLRINDSMDLNKMIYLLGKTVEVISGEYYYVGFEKSGIMHKFVGVTYEGEVYYLPFHILYNGQPMYHSRKIIR